ncbi:hypothetical protein Tco_0090526 [Tanacetum coccineum]
MLVLWNNKEVDWQTESEIKRDFPDFVTKVSFPKPPATGSGCTTALNVVPWETDGESVLREAFENGENDFGTTPTANISGKRNEIHIEKRYDNGIKKCYPIWESIQLPSKRRVEIGRTLVIDDASYPRYETTDDNESHKMNDKIKPKTKRLNLEEWQRGKNPEIV